MTGLVDITGQRFGRLVALQRNGKSANGNAIWLCQCDCGRQTNVDSYRLRHGTTRSCGCMRRETSRQSLLNNPITRAHIGRPSGLFMADGVPVAAVTKNVRNTSGITGVSYDKSSNRWVARMMHKNQLVLNEAYSNFDSAAEARRRAERKFFPARYWQE